LEDASTSSLSTFRIACPICGEQRFWNGANAVQHVESGACVVGAVEVEKVHDVRFMTFATQNQAMHFYLTDVPRLTYGGGGSSNYPEEEVPELPYHCPDCNKYLLRQLSHVLQHQDNKHSQNVQRIGY
jgi:hypothetical protein